MSPWPVTYPDPNDRVPWPDNAPHTVDEALERFAGRSTGHCTEVLLKPLLDADNADEPACEVLVHFSGGWVSLPDREPRSYAERSTVHFYVHRWGDRDYSDALMLTAPRERARWTALVGADSARTFGIEARWDGLCLRVYDPEGLEGDDGLPERMALVMLDPTAPDALKVPSLSEDNAA